MLLDDVRDLLSTGASIGVTSTGIFVGNFPPTPDRAVWILESGGMSPEHTIDGGAVDEQPRIEVIVRAPDYEDARLMAHRIFTKLDGLGSRVINGCQYHWGEAVQSPFFLLKDDNDRFEIACNYQLVKAVSTT